MTAEAILSLRQNRLDNDEKPMSCIFQITTPKWQEILTNDESIKSIVKILDKYNIKWNEVDTVSGAFNLNRDWIETGDINCFIEYSGVYPVEWDAEDAATLAELDAEGKLTIRVIWHPEKEKYIPNN